MEFTRISDLKRVDFITSAITKSIPKGSEILDVGCGNGVISVAVGALGYNVTGIDSSEKSIAAAKKHSVLPNVNFIVVAAGEFSSPPEKYSAIICSEVLEHLHHPEKLLAVLHESLKPDGIMLVTVPNGRGPRELFVTKPVQSLKRKNNLAWKFLAAIKKLLGYRGTTVQSDADDLTHIQFFTYPALVKLAQTQGFKIIEVKRSNFVEQVFPFSLIMNRSRTLQRVDSRLADHLPLSFTSGFMTIWKKI